MPKKKGNKVWIVVAIVVILIIIAGGYWWLTRTSAISFYEATPAVAARDCGENLGCGNALLAVCNPGTFTAQSSRETINITVKDKANGGCAITSSVTVDQLAPFVQDGDDADGDGSLTMNCTSPLGMNFQSLTSWLQGPGLDSCSGEYKDFTVNLLEELGNL